MKNVRFLRRRHCVFFVFILLFAMQNAIGQDFNGPVQKEPHPFWSNVRFGGSLGLSFGNGYFTGSLAPSAVYDFNKTLSAGVTVSGAYAKQDNFSATSLGGSLIGMLRPIQAIQLSAEYEQLNINRRYELEGGNLTDNYWVPALFLGIGYNAGPVVTGVRYNVLHDKEKSFYSQAFMPFVSIYF